MLSESFGGVTVALERGNEIWCCSGQCGRCEVKVLADAKQKKAETRFDGLFAKEES